MKKPNTKGRNFLAAATHVIMAVADFGEDLCAHLFGGEVVSNDELYATFADVFVKKRNLAIQVKMCNSRHAHRPTVAQIAALRAEIGSVGFVVSVKRGVYALVFYRGVETRRLNNGKSKLLNRKLGLAGKRTVIARELQYAYIIDAHLMHYLSIHPGFARLRRSGGVRVCAERKLNRALGTQILYLNRRFLAGFMKDNPPEEIGEGLEKVFGTDGWNVSELKIPLRFKRELEPGFARTIPVRVIGSKSLVKNVSVLLAARKKAPMPLDN